MCTIPCFYQNEILLVIRSISLSSCFNDRIYSCLTESQLNENGNKRRTQHKWQTPHKVGLASNADLMKIVPSLTHTPYHKHYEWPINQNLTKNSSYIHPGHNDRDDHLPFYWPDVCTIDGTAMEINTNEERHKGPTFDDLWKYKVKYVTQTHLPYLWRWEDLSTMHNLLKNMKNTEITKIFIRMVIGHQSL